MQHQSEARHGAAAANNEATAVRIETTEQFDLRYCQRVGDRPDPEILLSQNSDFLGIFTANFAELVRELRPVRPTSHLDGKRRERNPVLRPNPKNCGSSRDEEGKMCIEMCRCCPAPPQLISILLTKIDGECHAISGRLPGISDDGISDPHHIILISRIRHIPSPDISFPSVVGSRHAGP